MGPTATLVPVGQVELLELPLVQDFPAGWLVEGVVAEEAAGGAGTDEGDVVQQGLDASVEEQRQDGSEHPDLAGVPEQAFEVLE